jgi:hypothetical protein
MEFTLSVKSRLEKKKNPPTVLLRGGHSVDRLTDIIQDFVAVIVECPNCSDIGVKLMVEGRSIFGHCLACGKRNALDSQFKKKAGQKLHSWILKNPPRLHQTLENQAMEMAMETENITFFANEGAAHPDEWFCDTSREAQIKRRNEELEELEDKRCKTYSNEQLIWELTEKKGEISEVAQNVWGEVHRQALCANGPDPKEKLKILLKVFMPDEKMPIERIPEQVLSEKQISILQFLVEKRSLDAGMLLEVLQEIFIVAHARLIPRFVLTLHALYETNVIVEETVLAWWATLEITVPASQHNLQRRVDKFRKASKAFVEWLETAEEEDEESD